LTEPRKLDLKEQLYPMAISDEDLIECWFDRLNEPDIVKDLGLSSARKLRFHWRRLKELGKLPLTSRVGVEGKFGQDSRRATGERDFLLEGCSRSTMNHAMTCSRRTTKCTAAAL
jgi:hypothetical protein